jgi:Flp pilus assembly protein TadG
MSLTWASATAAHRSQREIRRSRSDDSGIVIVWFALSLTVLLGFVGFAIDLSNWWRVSNQLQATSDAAALAGVVRLPGNLTAAREEAERIVLANSDTIGDITTNIDYGNNEAQLRVTTSVTVRNSFLGALGMGSTTLSRTSTAEYQGPIAMGSPENILGNDPESGTARDYWLMKASESNRKENGDRFGASLVDGAIGNKTDPVSTTSEYDPNGYSYLIRVEAGAPAGELVIDVYDPAHINVGYACGVSTDWAATGMPDPTLAAAWQATPAGSPLNVVPDNPLYGQGQMYSDATIRFGNDDTSPFCSGDSSPEGYGPVGPWSDQEITFIIRRPAANGGDPLSGAIINQVNCTSAERTFPAVGSWAGDTQDMQGFLAPDGWQRDNPTGRYVRKVFHRWVRICRIPAPVAGDYAIQTVTRPGDEGQNRFSLRAGIVASGSNASPTLGQNQGVKVFANGRLPIYVNALRPTGLPGTPEFYVAEIPAGNGGRVLTLEFWDIGDVGSADGNPAYTTFEVLAPSGGVTCSITPVLAGAVANGCQLSGIESYSWPQWLYQGQLVTARITLPTNYSCSSNPAIGCWFRVRMSYSPNARPVDSTTWTARLDGNPVRLVRNP